MIGNESFALMYLVEDNDTKARFAFKILSKKYLFWPTKGRKSMINNQSNPNFEDPENLHIMNLKDVYWSKNSIYIVLELLYSGELLNRTPRK